MHSVQKPRSVTYANVHSLDEFFFSKGFPPSTHRWYRQKLTTFKQWCLEHSCTTTDALSAPTIRQFIHHLRSAPSVHTGQLLTGNTLHGFMRCIKAFVNWGIREGLVDERIPRHLEMHKKEVKVIEVFTPQQIEQLLTACEREELPWLVERDKAILAVLFDTGLRAKELCDLTLDRARMTVDDSYLVVNGKGRKQGEVGLGKLSRQLLHRYIHRHRPQCEDSHVFLSKKGGPLTPGGLDRLFYRLRDRSSISYNSHSWNSIRSIEIAAPMNTAAMIRHSMSQDLV